PAVARDRRDQVGRGEVSGARGLHDPLGRGTLREGVQGAASLVRARRHARVPDALTRRADTPYPTGAFPRRGNSPTDSVFSFHALVPVVGIPPRAVRGRTTIYEVRRRYGEGEEGVRRLLDQLQGLQGYGRVDLRRLADRALRDDEEDLGLCEAQEAGRQEVVVPLLRAVTGGLRSASRPFVLGMRRFSGWAARARRRDQCGSVSSVSTTRSARPPSSSSGAPERLHQAVW